MPVLDEIAELPLDLQPKLLRVLQEGEVRKVGATRSEKINTRVVAAAGRDLQEAVENNQFRSDLYYRLAVVDINLPPLEVETEPPTVSGDQSSVTINARTKGIGDIYTTTLIYTINSGAKASRTMTEAGPTRNTPRGRHRIS